MFELEDLPQRLLWLIPLILSLTVHEWAHAVTADWLGDDTARLLGRKTLDPLSHIDPIGTVLLPLIGIPFGWAKPVPINPVRFRRQVSMKSGVMLVAIAGPISNLCLAGMLFLLDQLPILHDRSLQAIVRLTAQLNLVLAIFNLLPIPPLDGSRVVDALIPDAYRNTWNQFGVMGPAVLIALFVLIPMISGMSMFGWIIGH